MLAAAVGGAVAACAPRCRSLCCRLMASALFGMRAAPSRRNGGPRPSSALPLFRCRRPRLRRWRRQRGAKACAPAAGFRCAPLCPCCAVAPFAGLAAANQGRGGLLQRPLAAAPLRRRAPPLQPRPPVLAPGRGYFVFAAAGLGIAPPAGGAKGLPGCTRCAMWVRCTWLRHESSANRYVLQPRLTIVRRE